MIANSAETKMIAGMIWNANTTPRLECCFPISPNTNAEPAEDRLPDRHAEHEDREYQLQADPPRDHAAADRAPVPRERNADAEDEDDPEDSREPRTDRAGLGCHRGCDHLSLCGVLRRSLHRRTAQRVEHKAWQ